MKCPNPKCTCELVADSISNEMKCLTCGFHHMFPFPAEMMNNPTPQVLKIAETWFKEWLAKQPVPAPYVDKVETPYPSSGNNLYNLGWGTQHPGHLTILIDLSQSMSMEEGWNKNVDDVLEAVTTLLEEIKSRGVENEEIYERFSVTVLGYNSKVFTLFEGGVEKLVDRFNSIEEREPLFDKNKDAKPQFQTYTTLAFEAACKDIKNWIKKQRDAKMPVPAPIVIHITDGKPEEINKTFEQCCKEAKEKAQELKSIMADDGNTLFFNIHFNNATKEDKTVMFPSTPPSDKFKRFLYDISSELAPKFVILAQEKFNLPAELGSRGMISDCKDKTMLLKFITWSSLTTSCEETPMI